MENSYIYTGHPITPKYTLNIGDRILKSDTDFDVEFADNIDVGTAHVTIKGKGKFTGVIQRTFEIKPVPARSLAFFADNTKFEYTGEPCLMKVAVKFGDIVLEEGKDYTVEYLDNLNPGKATARITFQGNYSGIMTIPFQILGQEETESDDTTVIDDDEDEEEEILTDPLINLSEVSSLTAKPGEAVQINAQAQGGEGDYSYAVFYRKAAIKKWRVAQEFDANDTISLKLLTPVKYLVCVKVKDSAGNIDKKYFEINVSDKASQEPEQKSEQEPEQDSEA